MSIFLPISHYFLNIVPLLNACGPPALSSPTNGGDKASDDLISLWSKITSTCISSLWHLWHDQQEWVQDCSRNRCCSRRDTLAGWPGQHCTKLCGSILPLIGPIFLLWGLFDQCRVGAVSCTLHCGVRMKISSFKSRSQQTFAYCRRDAQEIWAHLGKVNRKNVKEGIVIQIYR